MRTGGSNRWEHRMALMKPLQVGKDCEDRAVPSFHSKSMACEVQRIIKALDTLARYLSVRFFRLFVLFL